MSKFKINCYARRKCQIWWCWFFISEIITEKKKPIPVLKFGIPDYFLDHGTQGELLEEAGLTYDKIASEINNFLK